MKYDDPELIERTLEGDQDAFAALVEKYQEQIHALVWQKIDDFHIAQEITQDTFLTAYQKLPSLIDPKRFAGWLYVIANRKCIAWHRKKTLEPQSLDAMNSVELEKIYYSKYMLRQNEEAANEKRRAVVQKLLSKLSESDRTVVTLYYIAEMTCEEIAKVLGVAPNTVRSRLYRARNQLKEEIKLIEENLSSFQFPTQMTENIMEEISKSTLTTSSGNKPLIPLAISAAAAILVVLLMGVGMQFLYRFQKPYHLDAQSEPTIEITDIQLVIDTPAKPALRNQFGRSDVSGNNTGTGQEQNDRLYATTNLVESGDSSGQYMVKLVHFLPKDRVPQQDINAKIDSLMKQTQEFFADQMESYGYGRRTFQVETDANGNAVVHQVIGKHNEAYYLKYPANSFGEFVNRIQTHNTILVVFIDNSKKTIGNDAFGAAYTGGRVLLPAFGNHFNLLNAAHHLGYTFQLPHDPRDGTYLMSYGPTRNRISESAAEWLAVHPYFTPNRSDSNKHGQIDILASVAYPSNDTHVFFEVADPDGLHMMRFLHGYLIMHSSKSLSGVREIVKLTTSTVKNNRAFVQIVDVNGHIKYAGWRSFAEIQPNLVLDIFPQGTSKDDGLISYWPFDEANGEFAFDVSGNGSYARLSESTLLEFNGGKIGGALRLDGSKENATVVKSEDLINGLSALTLSLWVKSNWYNTNRGFINGRTPNGKDRFFSFRYDKDGFSGGENNVIKAGITTTEGTHVFESSGNVQTTAWQHLAFTWRSGEPMKLYIDGERDTPSFIQPAVSGTITDVNKLLIGKGCKDINRSWEGLIDDVHLYNRVLNETEIRDLAFIEKDTDPFHGVVLTGMCNLTSETIHTDADIEYILTVTNIGNVQDTIKLTTSGGTDVTLSPTSVSLAPGVSSKVTLVVTDVVRTTVGDYTVNVTAISESDNTKTAQITATISIPPIYEVALSRIGTMTRETVDANTGVAYTIKVTNSGNTEDTIKLTTSDDAIATLSQASLSLAPGASSKVTLSVAGAATATDYLVKVIGTSENDNTKTDQLTTLTTVYPRANARRNLKDGLVGHWTFDETRGRNVSDVSGNGNNAILKATGNPWKPNDGKIRGAVQFKDTDGATVVNGADLINGLEAFTITFWVKSAEVRTDSGFIFSKTPNGKDEVFSMRYDAKGKRGGGRNVIKASITTTEGAQVYESASGVQTTEWQHIALTWRRGRELTFYIKGVLDQPTFNSEATHGKLVGADRLLIGRGGKDIKGSWEGLIDDVRLYNRVLSPKEIANLVTVTTIDRHSAK